MVLIPASFSAGKSTAKVLVYPEHFGSIFASKRLECFTSRAEAKRHIRVVYTTFEQHNTRMLNLS